MRKMTRFITAVTAAAITAVSLQTAVFAADIPQAPLPGPAAPQATDITVPTVIDPVDAFLAQSAFIGNSVGEGLTMYNNAHKKVPLGNATMLTRVSYSFYADANNMSKYLPRLNGTPMRAKDAVKQSGAQYVFICMGTNDLVGSSSPETAFARYQEYILGILSENPAVTLFIESCTPTTPKSNVNNAKVTAFNAYMMNYCAAFPNMHYVDIATPLKDSNGFLAANLSSDGSVHLTMNAYAIWANTVRAYIGAFLTARATAMKEERDRAAALNKANYEKNMRMVDEKKQELFEVRMQAKREAEAAEEAKKREELLNVPDEVTLMHKLIAANNSRYTPVDSVPAVANISSIAYR
ncbi:MAG: hypothetical protein K6F87_07305 [Lachnospiraceae bacterium]|nr:hypothetical protein [Lachnospiraceae bacterium]